MTRWRLPRMIKSVACVRPSFLATSRDDTLAIAVESIIMPVTIHTASADDQYAIKEIVRAALINPINLDWQRFLLARVGPGYHRRRPGQAARGWQPRASFDGSRAGMAGQWRWRRADSRAAIARDRPAAPDVRRAASNITSASASSSLIDALCRHTSAASCCWRRCIRLLSLNRLRLIVMGREG